MVLVRLPGCAGSSEPSLLAYSITTNISWIGSEIIKLFSCSTQLSTKFILLINVKMPTIVGILTFISMINTTSERLKARSFFICQYLGDNCFWNFYMGRYIVGYTVRNLVLQRHPSQAVKLNCLPYIRQYTYPNEKFEYGYPHSNALLQFRL